MRIEKGHVAGGELNGTTTPADLGLGRMMSSKKDYHRPNDGAARRSECAPIATSLVGIRPVDPTDRLTAGAHLLTRGDAPSLENDQGYITSVAFSPMLGSGLGSHC